MHKIEERAVVIDGQVVARPMMYLALTYDHRLIDGREAVQFLVRVKECIEDPGRLMLGVGSCNTSRVVTLLRSVAKLWPHFFGRDRNEHPASPGRLAAGGPRRHR